MASADITVDPTTKQLKFPNPLNIGSGGVVEVLAGGMHVFDAGSTLDARNATVLLPSTPTTVPNIVSIPTIAALRGASVAGLPSGAYIALFGYHSANDGGGGIFVYSAGSSAADDGGLVIAPTVGAGRFLRLYTPGFVSARWFGAVGDGATNDTAAFTAAMAALDALNGGELFIPLGNYLIDSLTVVNRAKTIRGQCVGTISQSIGVSLICRATCTNFVLISGVSHVIENILIDGNNFATNPCRYTNNITDVEMRNVTITGSVDGGTTLNLSPITGNTQVSELRFNGVVLSGRSGGSNITNLLVTSDQSLVISFYHLKSGDAKYGVHIAQGQVFFETPFFSGNTTYDVLCDNGVLNIYNGRSESSTIDSILIAGGSGTVTLIDYVHGSTIAQTTLTVSGGFTGKILLLGGTYTNIAQSSANGLVWVNVTLYPGGVVTGTHADNVVKLEGLSLQLGFQMRLFAGSGDPNGQITAEIGSVYLKQYAGSGVPSIYIKQSGSGNTGWEQIYSGSKGSFTCSAAAFTTVSDPAVVSSSVILIMPTNASAAALMAGASSLYVSNKTVGTSFRVSTANNAAAAGSETFDYVIIH